MTGAGPPLGGARLARGASNRRRAWQCHGSGEAPGVFHASHIGFSNFGSPESHFSIFFPEAYALKLMDVSFFGNMGKRQ